MDRACTQKEVSSNSSSSPAAAALGFPSPIDFLCCVRLDGKLGGRVLNMASSWRGSPDVMVCVPLFPCAVT